jgi:hypothetical protein
MAARALAAAATLALASAALQPRALAALPYLNVTPAGWLRAELQVQADGLQGAFPTRFAPFNESQWLGGADKTQDWMESLVRLTRTTLRPPAAPATATLKPNPTRVPRP